MNRYTWRTGVREGVMIAIAAVFMVPVYILVNLSIRPATDLSSPLAPTLQPTLENFVDGWQRSGLGLAVVNSAIVTSVAVSCLVVAGSLASYAVVRSTRRWSSATFYFFLVGLLIPLQLGLVPLYQAFASLGLIGSTLPLMLMYVGIRLPFTMFLYTTFLRQLEPEYEEAAALDGASRFTTFRRIVFPLLRPITGTVVILNGLFVWNDFLIPTVYLSGSPSRTVPLAIYSFVNENATHWPLVFATLLMSMVPILIVFFIFQRTLIQGFASGVKG